MSIRTGNAYRLSPLERARLLKLAWDLAGTEFGARHVLYETFYSGDPSRLTVAFQGEYPKQAARNRVGAYLERGINQGGLTS